MKADIIKRYKNILFRNYNKFSTHDIKITFRYSSQEMLNMNINNVKYSIKDKFKIMKELSENKYFETIDILNGVKFIYKFKDISTLYVTIYKNGEIMFLYNEKNILNDKNLSLYFIDDFKKRFSNINKYCEFIFAKHLLKQTTLEKIKENILKEYPNYSSPYGLPDIKLANQNNYKNRIFINFLFNKKSYENLEKERTNSFYNDWFEKLPSINQLEKFIENEIDYFGISKKEIIEEHLNRNLKYTILNLYNHKMDQRHKITIYQDVNDIYDILSIKMITENKIKELLNYFEEDKFLTYEQDLELRKKEKELIKSFLF